MQKITIWDAFEASSKDGNFSHHMSNFAQWFLEDAELCMVEEEPSFYPTIDLDNYVYAACFVHYWCEVLLMIPPSWVYSERYKHNSPQYSYEELREELNRTTPHQFKFHNKYMRRMEVVYV